VYSLLFAPKYSLIAVVETGEMRRGELLLGLIIDEDEDELGSHESSV
jgi:hypothetical protein